MAKGSQVAVFFVSSCPSICMLAADSEAVSTVSWY